MTNTADEGRAPAAEPSSISSLLLERLKARRPEAWTRLADLYGPVIYRWCRQTGVARDDAPDVVQEVFAAVAGHIASFRRDRPGDRFSAWLGTITRNKIIDHFRARRAQPGAPGGTDAQVRLLQAPADSWSAVAAAPDEVRTILLRLGLDRVRAEFENRTWEAFWRTAVDGQGVSAIAADLGMSVPAVYKAKSRVLRRMRQELDGLLD